MVQDKANKNLGDISWFKRCESKNTIWSVIRRCVLRSWLSHVEEDSCWNLRDCKDKEGKWWRHLCFTEGKWCYAWREHPLPWSVWHVSILEKNISTHVPHLVPNSHWSHDNPNQFLSEIQAAKNESGRVTRKGIMKLLLLLCWITKKGIYSLIGCKYWPPRSQRQKIGNISFRNGQRRKHVRLQIFHTRTHSWHHCRKRWSGTREKMGFSSLQHCTCHQAMICQKMALFHVWSGLTLENLKVKMLQDKFVVLLINLRA